MMQLLKKIKGGLGNIQAVEEVDERKNEIAMVKVRDIKQYLVDEYERSQKLFDQNEYLRKRLDEAEELRHKYEATLVTLDAYQKRLESQEKRLTDKDRKIEDLQRQLADTRDETNSYKIQLSRAAITKDEIRGAVIDETKGAIIKAVLAQKGTLSKTKIVELVRDCEVRGGG